MIIIRPDLEKGLPASTHIGSDDFPISIGALFKFNYRHGCGELQEVMSIGQPLVAIDSNDNLVRVRA